MDSALTDEEWHDASDSDWKTEQRGEVESESTTDEDGIASDEDEEEVRRRERHEAFMEDMDKVPTPHPPQPRDIPQGRCF